MKKKKPFSSVERLLIAAIALCLAIAGAMGFLFFKVTCENREAEQELTLIEQQALRTAASQTPQPTPTAELTPENGTPIPEITPEITPEEIEPEEPETFELEGEDVEEEDPLLLAILYQQQEANKTPKPAAGTKSAPKRRTYAQKLAIKARYAVRRGTKQTPSPETEATAEPTTTPPRVGTTVQRDVRYSVDFDNLHEMNEEIVAWILQEGTEINFPIVQHSNNEYYLTHLYTGTRNKTGTIFEDCGNSPLFTDMCTYLYGHNRKNGAMFASLPNYMEYDYWQEHPTMLLITPYEDYEIEVFACVRESAAQEQTWRIKQFSRRNEYDEFVSSILERTSLDTGIIPQWGDQLLALCTCTNDAKDDRYIVFARMNPIEYSTESGISITKMQMDSLEGTSRLVNVPGRGMMQYYAQNDPVWAKMVYEPKGTTTYRPFGQGGCGPTSMAMAIANLVPMESMGGISAYARTESGFTFCRCSVNRYYCDRTHAQYKLTTAWEFKHYLPVVLANFATGNNSWNEKSRTENRGTGTAFMLRAAEAYGLEFTVSKSGEEAIAALKRGAMVVASTGGTESPFTGGGHYLTLAHADNTYLYIMDPYLKSDYSKTDKRHLLTQIQPGLLRARVEDMDQLLLYTFYIVENPMLR